MKHAEQLDAIRPGSFADYVFWTKFLCIYVIAYIAYLALRYLIAPTMRAFGKWI